MLSFVIGDGFGVFQSFKLTIALPSVVAPNEIVLFRSEIFGGLSNEVSVLLDQSTLPKDMEGISFGLHPHFFPSDATAFIAKGYLKKLDEDPAATVCLGDSAYHRSSVKEKLGIQRPVKLRSDGVQQKVMFLSKPRAMLMQRCPRGKK